MRKAYLFNYVFLLGVVVLFVNDHFLKWQYHNWWTGKLSDFVGLLIFPLFLAFLFPKFARWTALATGLFFIFWKLPVSGSFIEFYNQFALIPITRTIDYSDLLALSMLPVAHFTVCHIGESPLSLPQLKLNTYWIWIPASLVFMATSPPPRFYYTYATGDLRCYNCSTKIKMSSADILSRLQKMGHNPYVDTLLINHPDWHPRYGVDTMQSDRRGYFRIDQLVIEEDTITDFQFYLLPMGKNKTKVYLNGMNISEEIEDAMMEKKLRKHYRKLLKKYLDQQLEQ